MIPQQAQKVNPPRTLAVPFEMGRPLGAPNDPALQHRVLDAALALLARTEGPVFAEFAEEAPLAAADPSPAWSCPVSFAPAPDTASLAHQATDELTLLRPWYDKGKAERGHTAVGVSALPVEQAAKFLASFLDNAPGAQSEYSLGEQSLGDAMKYAAEDLKAFYHEAATSQPGAASAKALEDWYWGETSAGKLVREVRLACAEHDDPGVKLTSQFLLVPHTQVFRDA